MSSSGGAMISRQALSRPSDRRETVVSERDYAIMRGSHQVLRHVAATPRSEISRIKSAGRSRNPLESIAVVLRVLEGKKVKGIEENMKYQS